MSGSGQPDGFETRAREVLDESVTRVSGHVRSRLNQARQAALAEIGARPRSLWGSPAFLPAAGATAAAVLIAIVLLSTRGTGGPFGIERPASYEDIEMLTDLEALELVENGDRSFYEWAASVGQGVIQEEGGGA
jgi:hypothetical protein